MKKAKKRPAVVQAYRLGDESDVVDGLTAEGEIRLRGDGSFEVFSQEAKAVYENSGEIAHTGDYIKLDSSGTPYPNQRRIFRRKPSSYCRGILRAKVKCGVRMDVWGSYGTGNAVSRGT